MSKGHLGNRMVHKQHKVGLFGKLPHYGDFLTRDLPSNCIEVWDAWLQGYISGAQEQLGGGWLDVYLTSPIWRFVLSPGVIDNHTWLGIMLPSVDRVGRYFPFSVLVPVTTSLPTTLIHEQAGPWFEQIEHTVLDALDHSTPIDTLSEQLNNIALLEHVSYQLSNNPASHTGTVVPTATTPADSSAYALMLGQMMQTHYGSYSVWSTQGSEFVEPCMMTCQALPAISAIAAMLDGDWLQSQWHMPYHFVGEHAADPQDNASAYEHNEPSFQAPNTVAAPNEAPTHELSSPSSASPQASGALGAFDDQIEKMTQSVEANPKADLESSLSTQTFGQQQAEYNPDITQPWSLGDNPLSTKVDADVALDAPSNHIHPQAMDQTAHQENHSLKSTLSPFDEPHDIPDAQADPFDHLGVFDEAPLADHKNTHTDAPSQNNILHTRNEKPHTDFDISGIDAAQIDIDNLDPFESELAKYQEPSQVNPTKKEPK